MADQSEKSNVQQEGNEEFYQILSDFIKRRDAGENVDVEDFCKEHPEHATALRSYAAGDGLLNAMLDENESGQIPLHQRSSQSVMARAVETVRPGAAHATDSPIKEQFGRYRIIRMLGEGAMGAIYLAEDTKLEREVALKIPKLTGMEGADFLQRFSREAKAAARLDHPNICRVHDADEYEGTPFITMAYIEGQPLTRYIGTPEFDDQRRVVEMIRDIADGLEHAHQQQILHRDLKPGNVIVQLDGSPCITDFGLARRVDTGEESRITQEGSIIGTPAYMSPEQIEGQQDKVNSPADIYSLGVIFYELLTQNLPFQGSVMSILGQAMRDRPKPLSKLRSDVDSDLEQLCLKMLEKKPADRPASMQAVVDELNKWLEKTPEDQKAADAKAKRQLDQLEANKARIQELIERGQYAAAIKGLEKLAAVTHPIAEEFVAWAKKKLPEVQAMPEKLKQGIPSLVTSANKFISRNDYAQAAELLSKIPANQRTDEAQQLLDKAIDLQDEADLLLADLKDCVKRRQYNGIMDNLQRFLELKPGNKFANNLHKTLTSYGTGKRKKKKFRFDNKGKLLPAESGSIWDSFAVMGAVVFLTVLGGVSWGIMIYLGDSDQKIAVEIDEKWLEDQGGKITLAVDGNEHTIIGPGINIKVALGKRGFSVKNGDAVVHNPQEFTIEKEGRKILRIDATGMHFGAEGPDLDPTNEAVAANEENKALSNLKEEPDNGIPFVNRTFSFPSDKQPDSRISVSGKVALAVAVSTDGSLVATGGNSPQIAVWDTINKRAFATIDSKSTRVDGLAFSPDGKTLACFCALMPNSSVKLWNVQTRTMIREFGAGQTPIRSIEYSPDGKSIACGGSNGTIRLFDTGNGALLQKIQGTAPFITSISFSPDGKSLIAEGADKSINEWNTSNGQRVTSFEAPEDDGNHRPLANVDVSVNGTVVASAQLRDESVVIHDRKTDKIIETLDSASSTIGALKFLPSGGDLIAGGTDGSLTLWNAKRGQKKDTVQTSLERVRCIDVSKDGGYLAVGGNGDYVEVWKLDVQEIKDSDNTIRDLNHISAPRTPLPDGPPGLVMKLAAHKKGILHLDFSHDGRQLISIGKDQTLRFWDLEKQELLATVDVPLNVPRFAVSSKGVVSKNVHSKMQTFDVVTHELLHEFPCEEKDGYQMTYSADGRYLASMSQNGILRVWNNHNLSNTELILEVGNDQQIASYPGPKFVGDTAQLAVIRDDRTLLIFDLEQDSAKRSIPRELSLKSSIKLGSFEISPDGRTVMLNYFGNAEFYDLETGNRIAENQSLYRFSKFLPWGKHVIGPTGNNGSVGIVDTNSGQLKHSIPVPDEFKNEKGVNYVAVSPDGRFVAMGGGSYWDGDTNQPVNTGDYTIYIWRLPKEVWANNIADSNLSAKNNDVKSQTTTPAVEAQIRQSLILNKPSGTKTPGIAVVTSKGICTVRAGSFKTVELSVATSQETVEGTVASRRPFPFCWIDADDISSLNRKPATEAKAGVLKGGDTAYIAYKRGGEVHVHKGTISEFGAFKSDFEYSPTQRGIVQVGPVFTAEGQLAGYGVRMDLGNDIKIYQLRRQ